MKVNTLHKGIFAMAVCALMLVSCNKETKQADETATDTLTEPAPVTPDAATADTISTTQAAAPTIMAPANQAAPAAAPATATAPGMNPPHGQPGHTCAIPVGAPLSSAPKGQATAPAPIPQPAPQQFMQAPQPAPQPQGQVAATAPGMNPPHGQPGHTCAIPVGAPLPKS